jgi:hypothetical protein
MHVAYTVLAASNESKKSGPIGLAVILLLCVACYFLMKSMSKHLRKVREEFPVEERPSQTSQATNRVAAAAEAAGHVASGDAPDTPAEAANGTAPTVTVASQDHGKALDEHGAADA